MINVAFFGTSDKSTPILEVLNKNFNLKLCVTKVDTFIGRKKERRETEVKKWAKKANIELIEIYNLKGDNLSNVIRGLIKHNIDLCIVSDFSFIIPSGIFNTPRYGMINVHFSLLPKYRGASPIQHAILNNEKTTGVTFQLINAGMDTGDILCQYTYKLRGTETTQELTHSLYELAAANVIQCTIKYVKCDIKPKKQIESDATYCISKTHPKSTLIYKEDAKLSWTDDMLNIYAKIRAFYAWPIAHTTLHDMKRHDLRYNTQGICFCIDLAQCKIFDTAKSDLSVKIYKAHINKLNGCATLCVDEIQVEGGNKMKWKDFVNGYAL